MKKVFLITVLFFLAVSTVQASLSPLADANESLIFADDFLNNDNGWSNIGTEAGEATIGTDPGGTGASVWYPSQDGTYTPSVMTYGTAAIISEGSINVYFRARVDSVSGGNANRFYWKVDEASPSYVADMADFTVRPASISTYTYYNASGAAANVHASVLTFPDTSTFVNFLLKMTDNEDGSMTLEAFYYDPNSSDYVAVSPTVTDARIITGSFARYSIGSVNAAGGNNRVYIDSIMVTQVPEPATLMLLGIGSFGILTYRKYRSI